MSQQLERTKTNTVYDGTNIQFPDMGKDVDLKTALKPLIEPDDVLKHWVPGIGDQDTRALPLPLNSFAGIDESAIEPRRWLVYGKLIRKNLTLVVAPGASAKSTIVDTLTIGLAAGKDLCGWGIVEPDPLRVMLANLEDGEDEICRRTAAIMKRHRIKAEDLGERLKQLSGRTTPICLTDAKGKVDPVACQQLLDTLVANKIDVLVMDPLVHAHSAEENSNTDMGAVFKALNMIAQHANAAIIAVHHVAKGGGEVTVDSGRGASAMRDAARVMLTINRMSADEATECRVRNPQNYVRVFAGKNNMAPPASESDWFEISGQQLDNGDSVGVVERWQPPGLWDGIAKDAYRQLYQALPGSEFYRADVRAANWIGRLVAELLDLDVKEDRERIKRMIHQFTQSGIIVKETMDTSDSKTVPIYVVGELPE